MSINTFQNNADLSTDTNGPQAINPDLLALMVGLDRLLSVGSYYTPSHDRYKQVAREAQSAIETVLGTLPALQIEISNDGFWIQDQEIPADTREARRFFELVNPLNIALLELKHGVTADDLHQALTVLNKLRTTLTGSQTYDEIEITGLPDTIATTDRSLYVRTKERAPQPGGTRPTDTMQDYQVIPEAQLVGTPAGQNMEREFLGIVKGILQGGDPTKLKNLVSKSDKEKAVGEWVPDSAIRSIKDILHALGQTNSDPMMFEHLINHAQSALELTGDPELVELVFARLRKEAPEKKKSKPLLATRPKPKNPKTRTIKYTMDIEMMREIIYSLENRAEPYEDLVGPANADSLGICLQVLAAAPTEQLAGGIAMTIHRTLATPEINTAEGHILSGALAAMLNSLDEDVVVMALPSVFSPLRRYHPELMGPVWLDIWKSLLTENARLMAWPFVVNDLLLGVEWEDPGKKLALFELISRVDTGHGIKLFQQLEDMEALKKETLSTELFHAPAPLLYPVHMVLLKSLDGDDHGQQLHRRLAHQRPHLLGDLLVRIMGEYRSSNKPIYQAILEQGVTERVSPNLREVATRFLCTAVMSAEPEERNEFWVTDAINWLGRLDMNRAESILMTVLKEKRFFILPVWPKDCRQAARNGLDNYMPDREAPAASSGQE